jgi:RimJ/RimL family protein N-acetyltransferase
MAERTIYHLRQNKPLTEKDQENYFNQVVENLFTQARPPQVLFSYLKGNECIGYGGLVHINWNDRNAEISFLIDTQREEREFHFHWSTYLGLIEQVAFQELKLHKVYTYAFDLRPHLYSVLEANVYLKEAVLKQHAYFDGGFIDVVIHSKINERLVLRRATMDDLDTTFKWASDDTVRKFSLNTHRISFPEHKTWFTSKLQDKNCLIFIVERDEVAIGSVRFDVNDKSEALISYLIAPELHGLGLGKSILHEAMKQLAGLEKIRVLKGVVLDENIPSIKVFERLGYSRSSIGDGKLLYEKILIDDDRKISD